MNISVIGWNAHSLWPHFNSSLPFHHGLQANSSCYIEEICLRLELLGKDLQEPQDGTQISSDHWTRNKEIFLKFCILLCKMSHTSCSTVLPLLTLWILKHWFEKACLGAVESIPEDKEVETSSPHFYFFLPGRGSLLLDFKSIYYSKETQRIVRKYYEQLYANKLDILDEMDKFPEIHYLPKLNQEELENLNWQLQLEKLKQ